MQFSASRALSDAFATFTRRFGPMAAVTIIFIVIEIAVFAVFGGSLVAALPGTERTVAALKKLEVLASVEIISNATTALSTHVLPSKDQLERADVKLNEAVSLRVALPATRAVVAPVADRSA